MESVASTQPPVTPDGYCFPANIEIPGIAAVLEANDPDDGRVFQLEDDNLEDEVKFQSSVGHGTTNVTVADGHKDSVVGRATALVRIHILGL